jgi:hypothetical protein
MRRHGPFAGSAVPLLAGLVLASAAPAPDAGLAAEARLAAAHPGLFHREGTTLVIGNQRFTDQGSCADDDGDCIEYRADRVRGDYVGVRVGRYEDSGYKFVGLGDFDTIDIGGDPEPSPDGRRFFVLNWDPHSEWSPAKGAAIWEWRQGPVRLRHVDEAITYVARLVAWRGNACVELEGAASDEARDAGRTHRIWLAELDGDWRLTRKRSSTCQD